MKIASRILLAAVLCGSWCAVPAHAAAANDKIVSVAVGGDKTWVDTGMDVNAGDKLHITATGTVTMGNNTGITPNGVQRGWVDTLRPLTVTQRGTRRPGWAHRQQRRRHALSGRRRWHRAGAHRRPAVSGYQPGRDPGAGRQVPGAD